MGGDFSLQYGTNFILISIQYIFFHLKTAWGFFNDYEYWRAGVIIVLGYFIAWSLSKDIPAVISRISGWLKFGLGKEIARLSGSLVFRSTFLVGIAIAVDSVNLPEKTTNIAISVIATLVIISIFSFANDLAHLTLRHLAGDEQAEDSSRLIQPKTLPIFEYSAMIFLSMAGLYSVFSVWGVEFTALLASLGVAGLAIGMAAKDTLSDIIAGVLILTDSPFVLGDSIEVKGAVGKITHIGLRNTRIRTKYNVEVVIPNSKIGSSEIINQTSNLKDNLLVKLPIKAAYGVDPKLIRDILVGVAHNNENIVQNGKIKVVLDDFNQAQTVFVLSCQVVKGETKNSTLAAMREAIYLEFLRQNIEVSLPNDLFIKEFPHIFSNGQPREFNHYQNFRSVG